MSIQIHAVSTAVLSVFATSESNNATTIENTPL